MISRIQVAFDTTVQSAFHSPDMSPMLVAAMEFAFALPVIAVGIARSPSNSPEVRKFFLPSGEEYRTIRRMFLSSQRMTIFIHSEQIRNIRVDAKWYKSGPGPECAHLFVVFDPTGRDVQASWSWSEDRVPA